MASITQVKGSWKATVSIGRGPDGNYRQRSRNFRTKKEAETWAADQQRRPTKANGFSVSQWCETWLEIKEREGIEPASRKWYEQRIRLYIGPQLGHVKLDRLQPMDVEGMLRDVAGKGKSRGVQRNILRTLRPALKDAVNRSLIADNPASKVKLPKLAAAARDKTKDCFNEDEMRRLLHAARKDRLFALYQLGLDSGMRPGELFALHWPEINWRANEVTVCRSLEEIAGKVRVKVTKTGRERTVKLTPETMLALQDHREKMIAEGHDASKGPVFVAQKGGFLRKSSFYHKSYKPTVQRAGVKLLKPSILRHTCATLSLMNGVDVKTVSVRLGHSTINITLEHYGRVLQPMQDRAVNVLSKLFSGADK